MSREKQDMGTVNTVRESDANIPGHRKKKKDCKDKHPNPTAVQFVSVTLRTWSLALSI